MMQVVRIIWMTLIFGVCCAINFDNINSIETSDIIDIFKEKGIESPDDIPALKEWVDNCKETVGDSHWRRIVQIPQRANQCITKYIRFQKLNTEIEESMERGELDLVFKKYCGRREKIQICLAKVMKSLDPCFDDEQMYSLNITKEAAEAALDFICSDNGDKIALFIAEDGVECVSNRSEKLQTCLKEAIPKTEALEADPKSLTINDLLINEDNCNRLFSAHDCIVNITETCKDPTPSNIINSIMTQGLKVTPCARSGARNRSSSFLTLLLPYLLMLLIAGLTAAHILL